jgi:hypothetical protein
MRDAIRTVIGIALLVTALAVVGGAMSSTHVDPAENCYGRC